jgi:hypothetical protein
MTVDTRSRAADDGTNVPAQMLGVLLAPTAYLAGLQLAYQLVPHDCHVRNSTLGHLIHGATVLVCLGGTLIAWRVLRSAPAEVPEDEYGAQGRTRFLGLVGVLISALSTLVALAQWLAVFFLSPCQ